MENVTVSTEQEMEEDDDDDQYHEYNHHHQPSTTTSSSALAVTIAISPPTTTDKKPIHDSRKLFQRLWTDEDEIELLQGFLHYTSQRGSSHHNDTALFYHQIKSKFQIDFNKNQLVDKIRRLKKKYRNVLNKISSGKDFSFKTPHDQATFQISRKIWSNIGQISGSGVLLHDNSAFDQDEINLNPNNHYYPNSNINLNLVHSVMMLGNAGEKESTQSRKRFRPQSATMRIDEKPHEFLNDGSGLGSGTKLNLNMNKDHNCINNSTAPANVAANVNNNREYENNCNNSSSNIPGLIEETVRSCVSPVLKELVGSSSSSSFMGLGWMNLIPIPIMPLSYSGLGGSSSSSGDAADEKWRKQQILELEVYAKRLELVQAQINAALEELRSIGGG